MLNIDKAASDVTRPLPLKTAAQRREQKARREHAKVIQHRMERELKQAEEAAQREKPKVRPKPHSPRPLHMPAEKNRHWKPTAEDFERLRRMRSGATESLAPIDNNSHLLTKTEASRNGTVQKLSARRPESAFGGLGFGMGTGDFSPTRSPTRPVTSQEQFRLPPPSLEMRKLQSALMTASTTSIDFFAPPTEPQPEDSEPLLYKLLQESPRRGSGMRAVQLRRSASGSPGRSSSQRRSPSKSDRDFTALSTKTSSLATLPGTKPVFGVAVGPLLTGSASMGSLWLP